MQTTNPVEIGEDCRKRHNNDTKKVSRRNSVTKREGQRENTSETPLSHRSKQGANFVWGQQSGAWGRAGNANLLGVKAALLGVCLG